MNDKEICDLYELTGADGKGFQGVYVLGSLLDKSERVAVISQQTRAINLIHSLLAERRLKARDRICIIGAGAAGLTAAAYAINQQVETTVLESCAPLWNLRGCRTRWLHPNLFRWWPEPRWQRTATELPVMNWYADYASNVGDLLLSKYRSFEAMQRSSLGLNIAQNIEICARPSGWQVSWVVPTDLDGDEIQRRSDFEAVVIAIGFGSEERIRDTEAGFYWLDDTLERDRPVPRSIRYLISGTGDGGLTDLLRIRIDGFRHHHLREALLTLTHKEDKILPEVKNLKDACANPSFDPTMGYLRLAERFPLVTLLRRTRPNTSVILANQSSGALMSGAWPISRFLAATLLQHDASYTKYKHGQATWNPVCRRNSSREPEPQPSHFTVNFKTDNATEGVEVDSVVARHGARKVYDRARYGTEPVSAVDAALMDFGFSSTAIESARRKWKTIADKGQVTDELIAPSSNQEASRRSRIATVVPALSGRTVIGMLSRLVSSAGPEADDRPRRDLKIVEPIVADDTAGLLAQLADQIPEKKGTSFVGSDWRWRLGPEVDRRCAIEAIWAADDSLGGLWEAADLQFTELERTWVLPRAPWAKPKPNSLLRNTHVARHWGDWELRYLRLGGQQRQKYKRRSNALAVEAGRQLGSLGAVRDASSKERLLAIVDLCTLRVRVAIYHNPQGRPRRLAHELGANMALISETLQVEWKLD